MRHTFLHFIHSLNILIHLISLQSISLYVFLKLSSTGKEELLIGSMNPELVTYHVHFSFKLDLRLQVSVESSEVLEQLTFQY